MSPSVSHPSKFRLQRQSLPEALATSLRERILNGEFKDGDALIQESIAAEYECSRMPVREAFRQLEAEGLIVSRLHKGAVVSTLPAEQIMELFELRATLESDILGRALAWLSEQDLAAAQAVLARLDAAYARHDVAAIGALNWEFHRTLYLPASRPQTLALVQGINVQTDRYIRLQLQLAADHSEIQREHQDILQLCAARDPGVVAYLQAHIVRAGQDLLDAIERRRTD